MESVLGGPTDGPVCDCFRGPEASLGCSASGRQSRESLRGLREFVTVRMMGSGGSDNGKEGTALLT